MQWPHDDRDPMREHLTHALLALQDAQRRTPTASARSAVLRAGVSSARTAMRTLGLGPPQAVRAPRRDAGRA